MVYSLTLRPWKSMWGNIKLYTRDRKVSTYHELDAKLALLALLSWRHWYRGNPSHPINPMNFFFSFFSCPHQYLANTEFIPSQIVFRILNILMEYVGIAWAIVFKRTPLQALEINFSFQPITRLDIFSWMSLKVLTLGLSLIIGKPKYFSYCIIICALTGLKLPPYPLVVYYD